MLPFRVTLDVVTAANLYTFVKNQLHHIASAKYHRDDLEVNSGKDAIFSFVGYFTLLKPKVISASGFNDESFIFFWL